LASGHPLDRARDGARRQASAAVAARGAPRQQRLRRRGRGLRDGRRLRFHHDDEIVRAGGPGFLGQEPGLREQVAIGGRAHDDGRLAHARPGPQRAR
jgi:hypothetical protein